jgi:hypothetical protein
MLVLLRLCVYILFFSIKIAVIYYYASIKEFLWKVEAIYDVKLLLTTIIPQI